MSIVCTSPTQVIESISTGPRLRRPFHRAQKRPACVYERSVRKHIFTSAHGLHCSTSLSSHECLLVSALMPTPIQ